jgi:hypothetical protein
VSKIEVLVPDGVADRQAPGAPTRSFDLAPRLPTMGARRVALHDNAKPGAAELLAPIGRALRASGAEPHRWSKAHAARPSPHLADVAAAVDAAVFALGD